MCRAAITPVMADLIGLAALAVPAAAQVTTSSGCPASTTFVSYAPGSGTGTFTPGASGAIGTPQTAFSAASEVGATSVSWDPTITVTLPSAGA